MGLVPYSRRCENSFCSLLASFRKSCAACYAFQHSLDRQAGRKARTRRCFAGLYESAVPVRAGGTLLACLHTGHVFLQKPGRGQFNRLAATLRRCEVKVDRRAVQQAYFQTPVLSPSQYRACVRLLAILATHLAAYAGRLHLQPRRTDSPAIARARSFLAAHCAEKLSLACVARAVNASPSYVSRHFKQETGRTFGDYLAGLRIEKAKPLLQHPNLRVSQVALEVGFGSVSQFNRTFKRLTGRSPGAWRARANPA
jgi:AraC-like DNA-binding protein